MKVGISMSGSSKLPGAPAGGAGGAAGRVCGRGWIGVLVGVACIFSMRFAWTARNGNPGIRIAGWAEYNYKGYQDQPAWPEFKRLMDTMNGLAPGRAFGYRRTSRPVGDRGVPAQYRRPGILAHGRGRRRVRRGRSQ
jgi:hypothetical protein